MLLNGRVAGFLERNVPRNLTLKPPSSLKGEDLTLDIIVHALGRVNFGCVWDFKGLVYPDIKLNGDTFYSFSAMLNSSLSLSLSHAASQKLGIFASMLAHAHPFILNGEL